MSPSVSHISSQTIEDRRVRLDSIRTLRYLKVGERFPGKKPAVLYLPPLGVTADFWAPNLLAMAATGRTAYALDIPGYGESSSPRSTYLGYFARVVSEFIRAMNLGAVTLVGNSLGGTLALGLYLQAPRQVSGLILVDAFGLGASLPIRFWNIWNLSLPSLWLGLFGRGNWAYWRTMRSVFCALPADVEDRFRIGSGWRWTLGAFARWPVLLALIRRLSLPGQRRSFLGSCRAQAERSPVPTLVVWGENDRMLPVEHTQEILAALPQAEIHVFPHTGHHPPAEAPTDFHRRLVKFLDQHGL